MRDKIKINGVTYQQVNEVLGLGDSGIAKAFETIDDKWFYIRAMFNNNFVKKGLVSKKDIRDIDDSMDTLEKIIRYLERLEEI